MTSHDRSQPVIFTATRMHCWRVIYRAKRGYNWPVLEVVQRKYNKYLLYHVLYDNIEWYMLSQGKMWMWKREPWWGNNSILVRVHNPVLDLGYEKPKRKTQRAVCPVWQSSNLSEGRPGKDGYSVVNCLCTRVLLILKLSLLPDSILRIPLCCW